MDKKLQIIKRLGEYDSLAIIKHIEKRLGEYDSLVDKIIFLGNIEDEIALHDYFTGYGNELMGVSNWIVNKKDEYENDRQSIPVYQKNDIQFELELLSTNLEKLKLLYRYKTDFVHMGYDTMSDNYNVLYKFILTEIDYYKILEKLGTGAEVPKLPKPGKIKWNGTPSQFGYLFTELIKQGFIEPPLYNGEMNIKGFARLCWECFNINTTPQNLEKECNPNKNDLSETKRAKFTIPNISDLA